MNYTRHCTLQPVTSPALQNTEKSARYIANAIQLTIWLCTSTRRECTSSISTALLTVFAGSLFNMRCDRATVQDLHDLRPVHTVLSTHFPNFRICFECTETFYFLSLIRNDTIQNAQFSARFPALNGAYSSSWNSPQNYGTPLVNGITQCYLPPDRGDRPA